MTSRERLLITLHGGIADSVTVAPFVQGEYLTYYHPHKKSVDRVIDTTELANEPDFDLLAKRRGQEPPHWFGRSRPGLELRTRETVRAGKPAGRSMISTSDYLEIGTPRENVVALIAAAQDEGRY